MTTYNVSIPDGKNSFFLEFLELIGAQYKKEDEIDFQLVCKLPRKQYGLKV